MELAGLHPTMVVAIARQHKSVLAKPALRSRHTSFRRQPVAALFNAHKVLELSPNIGFRVQLIPVILDTSARVSQTSINSISNAKIVRMVSRHARNVVNLRPRVSRNIILPEIGQIVPFSVLL